LNGLSAWLPPWQNNWNPDMDERTVSQQNYRHAISAEATERELRMCGFVLLNHFLAMQHELTEHLRLQPIELLILLATTTGNVQRVLRTEALPDVLRGSKPLPPELIVPVSRRAIARITRLSTETVRRHVDSMIKRGILESMPKGVRAPNRMTERWVRDATLRLILSLADSTEKLIALGVITPQIPQAAKPKQG
jgi:DNA-binding MarR family transcriptional regulator